MWRHVRGVRRVFVGAWALVASVAGAQTIADYSQAQRALLENTMAQAAARSAGLGASAPAAAASAPVAPSLPAPHVALPPSASVVQVSGVFAAGDLSVVEVVVNATSYLLAAGQGVPGTTWHVESVAIDRVVLSRHGGGSDFRDAEGLRKVYPLPALR